MGEPALTQAPGVGSVPEWHGGHGSCGGPPGFSGGWKGTWHLPVGVAVSPGQTPCVPNLFTGTRYWENTEITPAGNLQHVGIWPIKDFALG